MMLITTASDWKSIRNKYSKSYKCYINTKIHGTPPARAQFRLVSLTSHSGDQGLDSQVASSTTSYDEKRWSVMRETWVKHQRRNLSRLRCAVGGLSADCIAEALKGISAAVHRPTSNSIAFWIDAAQPMFLLCRQHWLPVSHFASRTVSHIQPSPATAGLS